VDPQACRVSQAGSSWMSLVASCAILAAVLAPAAILFAWIGVGRLSSESLAAAVIGGGICWFAASLALAATYLGNHWNAPVPGVLAGMLFRLGLPLAAVAVLSRLGGAWAPRGITTTILGAYVVALIAETALALRMIPHSPSPAKTPPAAKVA
jgi:hypothetical protein